ECQEPKNYQALLFENQALKDEIKNLRARLEETEELKRAISEGDLDALVIPGSKGELVFTLDSADRAYRLLVETMNEGTATLAFDGTILYCNRRLAELLNMHSQAIVGTPIHQFIAPESEIAFKAFLEHRINAGEINLRTKDGRSLPVYLSISSTQGGASPNAWCLVVTDLTEQKKNEEIVAAERLARSIIEQAAETIAVCDTSGMITHFSNSMSKLCRCNPMFQRFEDLINLQFAEGEAKGESILPVSSALKGSTILGMEAIFESENHQKSNLLLNTGPLKNDDGKIIGCTITLTDITERKQTEEDLRESQATLQASIQSMTDAVYISDIEGNFIDFNDSFVTFHRFHNKEEYYRKNFKYFLDTFEIYFINGTLVPVDMWPIAR
ncbi:MAG TPA: PAS domain S-box protein, partial [Methanosarcina sp.]|nr:PAS domain S-box protein [Methanosarcina sp.]